MHPELTQTPPPSETDAVSHIPERPGTHLSVLLSKLGETARQASLLFSAQTGSMLAGFGASLLQARFMEPAEVGRFAFCLSVVVVAGLGFEFGVSSAGARVLALARDQEGERSAVGGLLLITLGLSAAFAVFIVAAAGPIDLIFHKDVRWLLITTAPLAFFQPLQPLVEQSCQGLNQIRRLSIFQLTMAVIYVVLLAVLAVAGKLTAGAALASYLAGVAIAAIWALVQLRPSFKGATGFAKFAVRETRRYGLNLYVARMGGMASSRFADQLVIGFFRQETSLLGMYFIVQKFSNPIVMLARSLSMTRFRTFARGTRVSPRISRWNAAVLLFAATGLVFVGPPLVKLFFPKYGEAAWLLLPFSIAGLFAGLFQPYNIFLASQGRGRELRNIVLVVGIASLVALSLAVPRFGLAGAAWVAAAIMALDYGLHLYYYRLFRRSQAAATEQA
jgi:O-antigen/teichoic acid export membrane protein